MGGWKKISKPNSRRGVRIVERLEKSENFNSQGSRGERGVGGGFEIAFFFPFITMKTTVLTTFVYTVKVKYKQK